MPTMPNENEFSDFYFSSYGWLYLQFTSVSPQFSSVSPTKKKMRSKVAKFTGKIRIALKRIFFHHFFVFVRLLVFKIWSILYSYCRFWCTRSNTSKSTIRFKALRIFPVNLATVEQKYIFLFGDIRTWFRTLTSDTREPVD